MPLEQMTSEPAPQSVCLTSREYYSMVFSLFMFLALLITVSMSAGIYYKLVTFKHSSTVFTLCSERRDRSQSRKYDKRVINIRIVRRRYWLLMAKNEMVNSSSGLSDTGRGSTGRMSFSGRSFFSNLSFGKRKPFLNIRFVFSAIIVDFSLMLYRSTGLRWNLWK